MKKYLLIIIAILAISFNSCKQPKKTTIAIEINKFEKTELLAHNRSHELFDVFNEDLNPKEEDYLKFIYSYMPLCDLADYDGTFFLKHIKISLKAKDEIAWAKQIPEDIYKHFVLPHRVNNENLDTSRIVFYEALKDRIKGMDMYQAALEVNHWCHEKVEYHSADGRTSSPLATMKTAYGRCGEESTFAVAAMRAVCIPARQAYTPRWAHSDDNHAWIEVWADGKWYFLGACEPEPVLNKGWFSMPASRAMLVHAKVFGDYQGSEEVNISTSQFDDINVIERYAYTFKQFVKVTDNNGNAIKNSTVEYQLYNYAEFYPITKKKTNNEGISYLTTGLGELLIWCYNDDNYGYKKVIIGKEDTVNIVLNNPNFTNKHWELMPPPPSDKTTVEVSQEQIKQNKIALQREDSIRNNYVASFISKEKFIKSHDEKYWNFIKRSRGNYQEIINFIDANKDNKLTITLLEQLWDKDLRDIKASVLNDNLNASMAYYDDYSYGIFSKYILSPRIELEMLKAYKSFLLGKFSSDFVKSAKENPDNLINWIKDSIQINNERLAYNIPITPIGTYNLKVANTRSQKLFFVATARSFGIPAKLEAGTNIAQYLKNNQWVDVFFDGKPTVYKKLNVKLNIAEKNLKFTPQYYHHITLAIFENNRFNTLEYGEYQNIYELENLKLKSGFYQMITSNRLSSGKILVDFHYFNIEKDTILDITFPKEDENNIALGSLNRNKLINLIEGTNKVACSLEKQSDIVVAIIQPDKEPSKHILNDIQLIKNDFDKLKTTIVFIIAKEDESATFDIKNYPNLPKNRVIRVVDTNPQELLDIRIISKETGSLPKIMIIKPNGDIIYHSEGYKIGVSNDLLKKL